MTGRFEPRIVAFCCQYCSYSAADLAGSMRLSYPPNVKVVLVPCTGRVDPLHILRAIEDGADGVYVAGCLEGDCHFLEGNFKAKKRVAYVQRILSECGVEATRVRMFNIAASDGPGFAEAAIIMTETIRALGPNPLAAKNEKMAEELRVS
ncbi:MAG: hydrogenase iron-sulfur subunit [Thermodesulfobacteriota bacterium]